MNKNWRKKLSKILPKHISDDDMPYLPLASDIYLVSYPKSGNTWIRYMLSSYFEKSLDLPTKANWFTIQDIIPDIHVDRKIDTNNLLKKKYGSRIIKSHSFYNLQYNRVIYIARRPEDSISSCYNYLRNIGALPMHIEFMEFCTGNSFKYGIAGWNRHVLGWLNKYSVGKYIRYYKYEDFITKPHETLSQVIDLLGLPSCNDSIRYAIEQSSINNMRASEKVHKTDFQLDSSKESFTGIAKIGSSKHRISQNDIDFIKSKTIQARDYLGYD